MSNAAHNSRTDGSRGLEYALVEASPAPMLLLDSRQRVIVASASFCEDYEISCANIYGRPFANLGEGEWNVPKLSSLLTETAAGFSELNRFKCELKRRGHTPRHLLISAKRLRDESTERTRIALFILDRTEKRDADQRIQDMIKEKENLLEGVHRRVATSLQIVAITVAKKTSTEQSAGVRGHLCDIKQRVLALAAIEHQLAPAKTVNIEVRPYLDSLCASIRTSMLASRRPISLQALADNSIISAGASISIGVIVTELVLNAVVRAFACRSGGTITVEYKSRGLNWNLSVSDDGAGMRDSVGMERFGTKLIQAVATMQDAKMSVISDASGTTVSLSHTHAHALIRQFAALGGRLM